MGVRELRYGRNFPATHGTAWQGASRVLFHQWCQHAHESTPRTVLPSAGMIPVETAGRKLDDDSWDHREPALEDVSDGDNGFMDSDPPAGL